MYIVKQKCLNKLPAPLLDCIDSEACYFNCTYTVKSPNFVHLRSLTIFLNYRNKSIKGLKFRDEFKFASRTKARKWDHRENSWRWWFNIISQCIQEGPNLHTFLDFSHKRIGKMREKNRYIFIYILPYLFCK